MVLQVYQVKDRVQGQLASGISSGAAQLTLQSGQGASFPSTGVSILTIEKVTTNAYGVKTVTAYEYVLLTARTGDVCDITRAQFGSSAQAFDIDDYVTMYIHAEHLEEIFAELVRLENEKLSITEYLSATKVYAASSGGTDAYAVTLDETPAALVAGMRFMFQADVANTGSSTFNVGVGGAKTIKKMHDQDLGDGDIEAGQIVRVVYDGTYRQMSSQIATILATDIHGQTLENADFEENDEIQFYDDSAGGNKKRNALATTSRQGMIKTASQSNAEDMTITNRALVPQNLLNFFNVVAGSTLIASDDTTENTTSSTYVKLKQFTINKTGTYTVEFTIGGGGAGSYTLYGRIYKNGVAFGTERTGAGAYTENLAFTAGDTCELRGRINIVSGSPTLPLSNFRLKCALQLNTSYAPTPPTGSILAVVDSV